MIRLYVLFFLSLSAGAGFCASAVERGQVTFKNYCAGCHTLKYLKYDPLQAELSKNALTAEDALRWFGRSPPDLSLVAGVRGQAWLFTYLTSFYVDEHQRFGDNNLLLPQCVMPDPFVEVKKEISHEDFQRLLLDLVSFLESVSDPNAPLRHRLGPYVLCYVMLFWFVIYVLKKHYTRKSVKS
ncbi:MAG: cytochrome c1 [Legionellaceae bacterium]